MLHCLPAAWLCRRHGEQPCSKERRKQGFQAACSGPVQATIKPGQHSASSKGLPASLPGRLGTGQSMGVSLISGRMCFRTPQPLAVHTISQMPQMPSSLMLHCQLAAAAAAAGRQWRQPALMRQQQRMTGSSSSRNSSRNSSPKAAAAPPAQGCSCSWRAQKRWRMGGPHHAATTPSPWQLSTLQATLRRDAAPMALYTRWGVRLLGRRVAGHLPHALVCYHVVAGSGERARCRVAGYASSACLRPSCMVHLMHSNFRLPTLDCICFL